MDSPEAAALLQQLGLAWPGGLESILLPFHTRIASLLAYAVLQRQFPEKDYLDSTFSLMVQAVSRIGAVQDIRVPVIMTTHELSFRDLQHMFSASRLPVSVRAVFANGVFFGQCDANFGERGNMRLLRLLKARGGVDKIVVEF